MRVLMRDKDKIWQERAINPKNWDKLKAKYGDFIIKKDLLSRFDLY